MQGKIIKTTAEVVDGKVRLHIIMEIGAWEVMHFTDREEQVLVGIRRGQLNKEIAFDLGITERAVKYHVKNLLAKTGNRRRKELRLLGD